jgi:D-Tyr-tRNAtyr deacylase
MKVVLQRVSHATVTIGGTRAGGIARGYCLWSGSATATPPIR